MADMAEGWLEGWCHEEVEELRALCWPALSERLKARGVDKLGRRLHIAHLLRSSAPRDGPPVGASEEREKPAALHDAACHTGPKGLNVTTLAAAGEAPRDLSSAQCLALLAELNETYRQPDFASALMEAHAAGRGSDLRNRIGALVLRAQAPHLARFVPCTDLREAREEWHICRWVSG